MKARRADGRAARADGGAAGGGAVHGGAVDGGPVGGGAADGGAVDGGAVGGEAAGGGAAGGGGRPLDVAIGDRIRRLRRERGLRLVDLAAQTDLSASFISQMERGLTAGSIRSLLRLAAALGCSPHALLDEPPAGISRWTVSRAASRPEVANDSGTARSMVEPNPTFGVLDYVGGPEVYFTYYVFPGDSLLMVLGGRVEIDIEEEIVLLSTGDTVHLQAHVSYRWRRVGKARCRVIAVHLNHPGDSVVI